ncbi:MAG: hypothetical protein WCC04_20845 [Terriglobales bacterium]
MAIARIKGSEADSPQRKSLRLTVVVTDREQTPPSALDFPVLMRPSTITDDPEGFLADLGGLLRQAAEETGVERQAEPQRLFKAKEYRAAVISAMALLEAKLRECLNKIQWPQTRRPLSMRSLIDQAVDQHIIPQELRFRLDSWMRTRNEIVHSSMLISKAQVGEIVDGILKLIAQM